MAIKYLYIDPLKCTGCRNCELVCSYTFHKVFNYKKARLRVIRTEEGLDKPVACHHCNDAPCIRACPTGAISRTEKGLVYVSKEKCIGCGACVEACPFGAMFMDPDENYAMNCILCGECVKRCPAGALQILDSEQIAQIKSEQYISTLSKALLG